MPKISAMIDAGKASAGAPLGPALGPTGLNIGDVVSQINEKTKQFSGMKIPVEIEFDPVKKTFEVKVGSPPTSALIKKEAGVDKGTDNPKLNFVGNLSMEQVKKIAVQKLPDLGSYKLKHAVKEIIGTCDSLGITIEGKRAKTILESVDAGKYDSVLAE